MTSQTGTSPRGAKRGKLIAVILALAAVFLLLAANAHFLYVALMSQPECIAHVKPGVNVSGQFSAAKSAC
ncbi:hypothetical protein [Devosia naphthalenivorans]|uniref:hypothetical protein n=1 Tax=Devosia naphthalenivorans TaxID=2082392 RepID=UPI000D337170|nr:hypothetical protein [Devosia naphthalenivorans]